MKIEIHTREEYDRAVDLLSAYKNNLYDTEPEILAILSDLLTVTTEYHKYNARDFMEPFEYQKRFMAAGKDYKGRFFMAGNQLGKTFTGALEMSYHLTGNYPEYWLGRRFDKPIRAWAIGISLDSTRRVLQKELFGTDNAKLEEYIGIGTIPKKYIGHLEKDGANITSARILHESGEESNLGFFSCEAGAERLMGERISCVWIDEVHPTQDMNIYSQCMMRTVHTDGMVYVTGTPEAGKTPVVSLYMDTQSPERYLQNATWDESPLMTPEKIKQMLASFPKYQHDMRRKGLPMMGHGAVYPVDFETLKIPAFEIPDYWPRLCAIDIGITHDTAATWSAWDTEADIVYVYKHKTWNGLTPKDIVPDILEEGAWLPVIAPHDAQNTERGSGKAAITFYREAGLENISSTPFYNPAVMWNKGHKNLVEPGIIALTQRMEQLTVRIFDDDCMHKLFNELRVYHRKDGKIVKVQDDSCDSLRYSVLSVLAGRGKSLYEHTVDQQFYNNPPAGQFEGHAYYY